MKFIVRIFSLATALAACFVLVGCGRQPAVKGKVSVRGAPLNKGTVTFRSGDLVRGATISGDGTYTIPECPPGQYKVTVEVPSYKFAPNNHAVPKSAEMPGKVVPQDPPSPPAVAIDAKYRDLNQSGLSFTISSDAQNIDIELK
jgi:hypothetical protein